MQRIIILLLSAISIQLSAFGQGSLTPPAPPGPTFKTLQQVEPRTPVSSLPFTISQPGSYYLTTNLTGSFAGGISVGTNDVTLDLMGFTLAGGSGDGIIVTGIFTNITILNGAVRSWSGGGIQASTAAGCQFHDLRLLNNTDVGLIAGDNCSIVNCSALRNGQRGYSMLSGCSVINSMAISNVQEGIFTGHGSIVKDCAANHNAQSGILVGSGSTVSGCSVAGNSLNGIMATNGCTVSSCTANSNGGDGIQGGFGSTISGSTLRLNLGDGIEVLAACHVFNNMCSNNGPGASDGGGINATGDGNRIDSNLVTGNDRGIDCNPATGNLITRNSARGNIVNFDIVAGNNSAVIIATPGVAFSSSEAWANFGF